MEKRRGAWKKGLWITTLIIIFLVISAFYANTWLQKTVADRIRTSLPGQQVYFSSVHTSIFSSSITINNLSFKIVPDNGRPGSHHISVGVVSITGIHYLNWLRSHMLDIDRIQLSNTSIGLNDELLQDKLASYHHILAGKDMNINGISINTLSTDSLKVWLLKNNDSSLLAEGDIYADNFISMKNAVAQNSFPVKSFRARLTRVAYLKGSYRYSLSNVNMNGNNNHISLNIGILQVEPIYSKYEFGRRVGYQVDRIVSTIRGISVKDIDPAAMRKQQLHAETMTIADANFNIFRDRRLPRRELIQPLPREMLKKISVSVRLNLLRVENCSLSYEEFPKHGHQSGMLTVKSMRISVSPFINFPSRADPAYTTIISRGSLMGSGVLYSKMLLPLHSDKYVVVGSIRKLDLTTLNNASENLGKIHIKSGLLDSLGFNFTFDEHRSSGKIIGVYHQLVIQPLTEKNGKMKLAPFKSFMLRHFIIPFNKDASLAESKRTGKIDYKRDPTRVVSYYMLQSLLTGIKSSFSLGFLLPK